ncbi:hypothetical protein B0H13DRAFT_2298343, partial [Mycena leptocephala]
HGAHGAGPVLEIRRCATVGCASALLSGRDAAIYPHGFGCGTIGGTDTDSRLTVPSRHGEPERRRTESPQSRARTGQRLARGHPRRGHTGLHAIISYDRILGEPFNLSSTLGKIAEFDTPLNLFNRNESLFRGLCDKSNITSGDIEKAIISDDVE